MIMPDEALQAAFEIKAACDDISRKLLRWHWEEKPGAHSVDALMKHLAQRQKESPDYYERLPELNGRTGWQQLDTTLCMRILLDPEKDAARPLDLLGNTPHPAAARRAPRAAAAPRGPPRAEPVMTLIPFSVPSFGFFLHPTKKRRTLQVVTQKYFSAFASRFFG